MRLMGATLVLLAAMSATWTTAFFAVHPLASAQSIGSDSPAVTGALPPLLPLVAQPVPPAAPRVAPKQAVPLRDSYGAIPQSERMSLQADLMWTGLYSGPLNGEYSDQLVAAVRKFQAQIKTRQTGVLNPQERQQLADQARPLQELVGWQVVVEPTTGMRLGLPMKLAPLASATKTGRLWSSAQGQVRIEIFRIAQSEMTLAQLFEQQKTEPAGRKIVHEALRPESFAVIGTQGLKKLYVRAFARDGEIRGISVLYDQAVEGTLDQLMTPMAYAFQPFANSPKAAQDEAAPKRKVEYGTGLVVSAAGHVLADLNAVDGCKTVVVARHGRADRLTEDRANNLALLRVYSTEDFVPLVVTGETAGGNNSDVVLVGIADPNAQAGGAAVTTVNARLANAPKGTPPALSQTPAVGFSGAAALDKSGHFVGMVGWKTAVVAGAPSAPRATIVPAEQIRNFLQANQVEPATGEAGLENVKASAVRVICIGR